MLARASARTIDEFLAIATRTVVVSHTGVRATCDHARNLSDAQIAGVAKTGGVVGIDIGFLAHAICSVDATSIARATRHTAQVAGIDHVALGSDLDGATTTAIDASGRDRDALLAEGLSDDEIVEIIGGNMLRLLLRRLPPRGSVQGALATSLNETRWYSVPFPSNGETRSATDSATLASRDCVALRRAMREKTTRDRSP